MKRQNVYDNPTFFEGYTALRENPANYNRLLEQPAIFSMLPPMEGLRVLDLGCGFGDGCAEYLARGAAEVVGVDLSEKMLRLAAQRHGELPVTFHRMDMTGIGSLPGRFDLVVSSLAVHYVGDFDRLAEAVAGKLRTGGWFVFSQEHPLTTAPKSWLGFETDEAGRPLFYRLSDYSVGGRRTDEWFDTRVEKYHRTFSEIVNTLTGVGFQLEQMDEPVPDEEALRCCPEMEKEFHKPSFLLIRARKG